MQSATYIKIREVAVGQELGVQIRRRGVGPGQVLFLREVHVRPQTDDDAEDVLDAHARRVHGLVVYLVLERAFVPRTGFSDVHRLREDGIPVDGERVTRVTEDVVQVFQLLVQFAIVHEPVVLVRPVGRAMREQDHTVRRRDAQELQAVPALVSRVKRALPEPGATDRARRTVKESENVERWETGVVAYTPRVFRNSPRPLGHARAEKPMRVIDKHPLAYLQVVLLYSSENPRNGQL